MKQFLIISFCTVYLLFAVFWDHPRPSALLKRIKSLLARPVFGMGLDHCWSMFAQNDTRTTHYHRVWLCKGSHRVPAEIPNLFEFKRWQVRLVLRTHHQLIVPYLRWLANRQGSEFKFDVVELVQHVYVRHPDLSRTEPESLTESVLARYEVPRDAR